jgi:RimJ/RimL family protein N-acetyltransferase
MIPSLITSLQNKSHLINMPNKFIPGKIVSEVTLKNGESATIRYPQWEDLTELTKFINEISQENIFVSYSGEVITREQESNWIADISVRMESGDAVYLVAHNGSRIVASFAIVRSEKIKTLTKHIGNYGAVIAKDYRGVGLGYQISTALITEARKNIMGLKQLQLGLFGNNEAALGLYHKLGFVECGRFQKGLFHKGEYQDEILMQMEL